jgi:hypothetical protein
LKSDSQNRLQVRVLAGVQRLPRPHGHGERSQPQRRPSDAGGRGKPEGDPEPVGDRVVDSAREGGRESILSIAMSAEKLFRTNFNPRILDKIIIKNKHLSD